MRKTIYALTFLVFGYGDELVFPIYFLDEKFQDSMGLLLFSGLFLVLCKTRNNTKKWFCKSCLQCFSSKNVLIKHKENCLSINGKQSVKKSIC